MNVTRPPSSSLAEDPTNAPGASPDPPDSTVFESILALALAAWCLAIFVIWLPGYLTWPYFTDHDHFGIVAQAWSLGKLPYRDVFTAQFPGEIYLFRILGSLSGWGNSVAFYAVDAAMVGLFGVLLVAWSLRQFGRSIPGLVGLTLFLGYYLSQDNHIAGQRDWHGTFFMMAGFFAPSLLPSRFGRVASGIAFGVALGFRPQFVLAVPGFVLELDRSSPAPGKTSRESLVQIMEWCVVVALTLFAMFIPLIAHGLMGEFVACLRSISYGQGYSFAPSVRMGRLTDLIATRPALILVPLAFLVVVGRSRGPDWKGALSAMALLEGMLLFKPLSPENHEYYLIPVLASFGVFCAYFAGAVLRPRPLMGPGRALIFILITMVAWSRPLEVSWTGTDRYRSGLTLQGTWKEFEQKSYGVVEAMGYLRRREMPILPPSGRFEITSSRPRQRFDFPDKRPADWDGFTERYPWNDFRAAIEYLRKSTTPETPVASVLFDCTTAVSATIPRPSPLFCDSLGLKSFDGLLSRNVAALEATNDGVVVWDPGWDEALYSKFEPLFRTIREKYRLEAAFGHIEVWRRIPAAGAEIAR